MTWLPLEYCLIGYLFSEQERCLKIDNEVGGAIARAANGILWMWRDLVREANASNNPDWHKFERRQALQDAISCMQREGLIEDYNMLECKVRINGQWSAADRVLIV